MPVAGRKPKPEGQRRNRAQHRHEWIEVEDRPFKNAPKLTKRQPNGLPWPAATGRWWTAISTMPHCMLWDKSDWQFAKDTAIIAAAFHAGDLVRAQELRYREKVMGTTIDARRDLRIRYVEPASPERREGVLAIEEYRERLAK